MNLSTIPSSHKFISIAAILWNIFGVMSFMGHAFWSESTFASLNDAQRSYMEAFPSWGYIVFGTAVTTGLLGSIGLMLRKSWTPMLFGISLVALLINQLYPFIATNYMELFPGAMSYILPLLIIGLGLVFWLYAKSAQRKGWLNA